MEERRESKGVQKKGLREIRKEIGRKKEEEGWREDELSSERERFDDRKREIRRKLREKREKNLEREIRDESAMEGVIARKGNGKRVRSN